jgi:dipeptidyl-peptidase-4
MVPLFLAAGCPRPVVRSAKCPKPAPAAPASQPAKPEVVADPGFLEQYAATFRFRLGHPKSFALTPGGEKVIFLRSGPRSFKHDLYTFDTQSGSTRVLLTVDKVLGGAKEKLSDEERARRERMRVLSRGIVSFSLSKDGRRLLVPLSGRLFVVTLADGKVTELRSQLKGYPIDPRLSPDGRLVACVRDGDLYLVEVKSRKQRRLTHRPGAHVENGLAEFVAQEEMRRYRGYWWSPDSRWIVYQQSDTSAVERMAIPDPARPLPPPKVRAYPRAGKPNAAVRLGLLSTRGGKTRWIHWDRERFPYLVNVVWRDKSPLSLVVQNRRQTEMAVLSVDPKSGKTRQLLLERDDAWLNIDPQMPRWLDDGSGFLWSTERGGAPQLELRDKEGKLLRKLTPLSLGYRKLLDLDLEAQELFVLGSGDPAERQIYRLLLSGKGPAVAVSHERGWHDAVFAREHGVYVQLIDLLDGQRRIEVHRRDGNLLGSIDSKAEQPPFSPWLEFTRVAAGEDARILHTALVRPRNFDPGRRYPVVLRVYGGPGYRTVRATGRSYLLHQWIADHGFVVVSIDGRGTPGQGRTWERSIKGDLIRIPLADQVAGLKALGTQFKELDLSRVGIYGWSFGGTMAAMAAMLHPETFRAAVAGAPVSDWLDYDTHYTERYLGLPKDNPQGYARSSPLTHVSRLERPLLLIHGTADDNVYFTHSVKLSDALFRAGQPHQFLPLTGLTHLVPDPLVTRRLYQRIVSFFQQHL